MPWHRRLVSRAGSRACLGHLRPAPKERIAAPAQPVRRDFLSGSAAHPGLPALAQETSIAFICDGVTHGVIIATLADLRHFAAGSPQHPQSRNQVKPDSLLGQCHGIPPGRQARLWVRQLSVELWPTRTVTEATGRGFAYD